MGALGASGADLTRTPFIQPHRGSNQNRRVKTISRAVRTRIASRARKFH
jgi:hypothetical protein